MAQLSRNAQVLRYLVGVAPGIGHTKLAKFAYLADLEAWRFLGQPISDFEYVRDKHGPFDSRGFYSARDELLEAGYVTETPWEAGPYRGRDFNPTLEDPQYNFSESEAEVLRYVAETYMDLNARDLCEAVVYETEPMKEDVAFGEPLPMQMVKRPDDDLGFSLDRLLAGERSAREGRVRAKAKVLGELRTRYCG